MEKTSELEKKNMELIQSRNRIIGILLGSARIQYFRAFENHERRTL